MKNLVYQRQIETQDTLLRRIMDVATNIKDKPNEATSVTWSTHRQAWICTEADGGHF